MIPYGDDVPDNWQAADIAVALRFVTAFRLAIDGGAHRGAVTEQLARRFARVVAIEPGPLADRIVGADVVRAALGDRPGRCAMADGLENSGQRHIVKGDDVSVITLDSLGLAPDFIKLDVEGCEWSALMGGGSTIRAHRPVVMLEDNGLSERYGVPRGACRALMESWGAKLVAVCNKDEIYAW